MVINPKPSVVRTAIKQQYLVLLDLTNLTAHECHVQEVPSAERITKVFFIKENQFVG